MNNVPASPITSLLTSRIRLTRWLVIALLPVIVVLAPPHRAKWLEELFEVVGVLCLVVCLLGRGWTSLYISGRKNDELVMIGPYSVVRNPLYIFSFIGLIGIGVISEMVTLLVAAMTVFAVYYRTVVIREEQYLARLHGAAFADYAAVVPRWVPDFSKWRDISELRIEPRRILLNFIDSSFFFLSFMLFELLSYLRSIGAVPVLLIVP